MQGLQGVQGFPGTDGDDGIDGLPGLPGLPGIQGLQGLMGFPGMDGMEGEEGAFGVPGLPGLPGLPGIIGPMGLPGLDGDEGMMGVAGPQGLQGIPGLPGIPGLSIDGEDGFDGLPGVAGPRGAQGVPGPPGFDGEDAESLSVTASGVNITGNGVATRVAFWTSPTTLGSDANLFWDPANARLGIGTSTPALALDVAKQVQVQSDADTLVAGTNLITVIPNGITLGAGGAFGALVCASTVSMTGDPLAIATSLLFNFNSTLQSTVTLALSPVIPFVGQQRIRALTGTVITHTSVGSIPAMAALYSNLRFDRTGTGTGTVDNVASVWSVNNIGVGWTATNVYGTKIMDPGGTGTVTNLIAHDVDALTRGGLTVGYRSAITSAAGRWFLLSTGNAASAILGSVRVGSGTTAARGSSILDVDGGLTIKRTTVADADYTALLTDLIIEETSLTANRTITLPAASTAEVGKVYIFKKGTSAAFNVIILRAGADLIDGAATLTITASFGSAQIYSTGSGWRTF